MQPYNYKALLQEDLQHHYRRNIPILYDVKRVAGEDHCPLFTGSVTFAGLHFESNPAQPYVKRKDAEQSAAAAALEALNHAKAANRGSMRDALEFLRASYEVLGKDSNSVPAPPNQALFQTAAFQTPYFLPTAPAQLPSHQPTLFSHQPTLPSHQPTLFSHQPTLPSHQPTLPSTMTVTAAEPPVKLDPDALLAAKFIQTCTKYEFSDPSYALEALTDPSYEKTSPSTPTNERLGVWGRHITRAAFAKLLFSAFPPLSPKTMREELELGMRRERVYWIGESMGVRSKVREGSEPDGTDQDIVCDAVYAIMGAIAIDASKHREDDAVDVVGQVVALLWNDGRRFGGVV
ncbi:hypothetical protein HK104_010394 [Borealophlyctis nickersoniae]|nr:hypothetical protein HK104_010394 [Borealophlyctis nickersoniae]